MFKPIVTSVAALALFLTNSLSPAYTPSVMGAEAFSAVSQTIRLAGNSRYETAIKIAQEGWTDAGTVVLARGDKFPDALAGAVLAKSAAVNGPLLLTPPKSIPSDVVAEIERLGADKVYILGGTTAVSADIEKTLADKSITVERLEGRDRYETAANIALKAIPKADEAYLATGNAFADALSVSSYAAAKGIPLLLTDAKKVPQVTLEALKTLGVKKVTLIGGETVITPEVAAQLKGLKLEIPLTVDRLAGENRYATNINVLNTLSFNKEQIYTATGTDFPDALAGAALAAKGNYPILLLPKDKPNANANEFLTDARNAGATFALLGGWNVISYTLENIIRTGVDKPRISLQYLQAYGQSAYTEYISQINQIPGNAPNYVDFVVPNWFALDPVPSGSTESPGTFTGPWSGDSNNYKQLVDLAHSRGLRFLPMIGSIGSAAKTDAFLNSPTAQAEFISEVQKLLKKTGADGIAIDFETMSDTMGPQYTAFLKSLYEVMQQENRILVTAVPARTFATDWYQEFPYRDLAKYTDYLNIMTYDYSTSKPGPIAPLFWVENVLNYAKYVEEIDMSKVLLGLPYYGRDWRKNEETGTYFRSGVSLSMAQNLALEYGVEPVRQAWEEKGLGVPSFEYRDQDGMLHLVYYDDSQSWEEKLALLNEFGLGGVGSWSLMWVNDESSAVIFPLLQKYLR